MEKLKNIAMAFTLMSTIVTASYTIDNRYALASDLEETRSQLENSQKINKQMLQSFMKEQRITTLQDKIFDIQIKGELNNIDKARLDRWKSELIYLQSK